MSLLKIENIVKTFHAHTPDAHQALNHLSLTVEAGDFITLVGGNGAGKSTLLNAIAGTFTVDEGIIYLHNEDITYLDETSRASHIARVFQEPRQGTAPRMTVAENLALAQHRGEKRRFRRSITETDSQKFSEALETFNLDLENRLDAEIGLLSGGQRQAISLLMATLKQPELLLLDEHTAALDPRTAKQILSLSDQIIREQNLTGIMITHNLQDAIDYGNRMLVLHQGQLVREFSGAEKKALTPTDLYTYLEEVQS